MNAGSALFCTLLTSSLLFSCTSPKNPGVQRVRTNQPEEAEWPLAHTHQKILLRIDSIAYDTLPLLFVTPATDDQGAEYHHGLKPNIYFSLRNAGRKPLLIPITDDQYISGEEMSERTELSVYVPVLKSYAVNTTEVVDTGRHLVRTHPDGYVHKTPAVRLRPGELRSFHTRLEEHSIPDNTEEFLFFGFPFGERGQQQTALVFTIHTQSREVRRQGRMPFVIQNILR